MDQKGKNRLITYGSSNKKRRIALSPEREVDSMSSYQHNALSHPPTSQQAAMMSSPSASQINQVVEITGASSDLAIRYLKVKHNSIEQAVTALLDGEDINKLEKDEGWDEGMWGGDRNGDLHPLGQSAAPSRRPSPAPSLGIAQPTTQADEDNELAAAIAASQGGASSVFTGQETGVVGADGRELGPIPLSFGPATRETYDSGQWSMTVHSSGQEVVPDSEPGDRVHDDSAPRFLKHLPDGDYTPNFLSICHAIPKAKEAFLMRDHVQDDYGSDVDWWRGHSSSTPRIVHLAGGSPPDADSDQYDEFIVETQRLMAFLDHSMRRYASIGALTQTGLIKNVDFSSKTGSLLELVLQSWIAAASSKMDDPDSIEQVHGLFKTRVGTNAEEGMATPDMTVVDITVNSEPDYKTDLSELLDNLLWETDPNDDNMSDNYIERPAEILVMRLAHNKRDATQLGVEVPASLHLDKYMKENVASTRGIRQRMAQGRRYISQIEKIETKLKSWPHPQKKAQLGTRQLLQHTLGHFSGQNRKDADKADQTNNPSLANDERPHYAEITSELERIIANIDKKLETLTEEKEKTRKAIAEMSKSPPELEGVEPQHRYTLRGVATKPNITYILQWKDRSEHASTPLVDDTTPEDCQWWRVEYEPNGNTARMTTTKSADYDVLRAVELEHNSALLVYANESASSRDDYGEQLPPQLAQFIDQDNRHFNNELQRTKTQPPAYHDLTNDMSDIPRNTIERKGSDDSLNVAGPESPTRGNSPPPNYADGPDDYTAQQHHALGLGYGPKADLQGDPPVAEIHLDGEDTTLPRGSADVEMMERAHEPLLPGLGPAPGSGNGNGSDINMGGMESQDRPHR